MTRPLPSAERRPRHVRRVIAAVSAALVALAVAIVGGASAHAVVVAPTILLPNMTFVEGDAGTAGLTVNVGLTAPNPFTHTVRLHVIDFSAVPVPGGVGTYGTATPGSDYVAFPAFYLYFKPGQQSARFTIKTKGDITVEPSEEIDVRFDDTEFTVGDNDIDLFLANDDGAGTSATPVLLPPNQAIAEPDTGCFPYYVTIPLSRPVTVASTVDAVDYTAVPLPAPLVGTYGDATPGLDYKTFTAPTLRYAVGSRTANVKVSICGDTAVEPNEQIDIRFDNTTTIAIFDNDIDLFINNND